MLQLGDGIRGPHVCFAAGPPGVFAACVHQRLQGGLAGVGRAVLAQGFFGHIEEANAADLAGRAVEVFVHQRGVQAHGLKNLRPAVRHVGADAHLGHDFGQALAHRLDEVGLRLLRRGAQAGGQVRQGFQRQPGVDGLGPIPGQHGKVVYLAGAAGFHHQPGGGAQPFAHQVVVDGRQRQQRRNGDALSAHAPVGQDQDVAARLDGLHRQRAQRGQPRLDAVGPPGRGVGDVDLAAAQLAAGVLLNLAQPRHGPGIEHRLAHLQAQRRVHGVDVQQVGAWADEGHQRHHHRLADGVDGRVGHLRKQLAEVVRQRLAALREHGQRRIVAHGADAFLAAQSHGREQQLQVFLAVAKGLLQGRQRCRCQAGGCVLGRDAVQAHAHVVDPLPVGAGVGVLAFELFVLDDAALLQVDQKHAPRLQAPFAHDALLGNRQHARFRGQHHQIVVGDDEARRAQAVAVQRGTDLAAIGEHHGRGAVPRLHHGSVVLVEGALLRVHQRVLLPGFGDHHHHRLGQRVAGHDQQLQRVVEGGGVGLAFHGDGVELGQIVAQHGRAHHALTRPHPVEVALDGVDLAVVRHQPVGVGQRPRGKGVGGKPLVYQRQGRDHALILQIQVVLAHLIGQQQPFVDDGATRHAGHVVLGAVRQLQAGDAGRGRFADDVQLALQRIGHQHITAPANEHLADDRLAQAHGRRHGQRGIHRHIAPAQQHLAFGGNGAFQLLHAGLARGLLFGQKNHAHAVFAGRGQLYALAGHFGAVEGIGDLNQQPGTIAHQRVGPHSAPVVQVLQNLQALRHDGVGSTAFQVGDKTDTAGIVLGIGVQALGVGAVDFFGGR